MVELMVIDVWSLFFYAVLIHGWNTTHESAHEYQNLIFFNTMLFFSERVGTLVDDFFLLHWKSDVSHCSLNECAILTLIFISSELNPTTFWMFTLFTVHVRRPMQSTR